ncbi:MAG: PAS domain S-box protein, partial [Methylophilaceae bacterium]|nr:PAS domain S-box protein [Methylophilaceae bacterium]
MRTNLPVTNNEYVLTDDDTIVSTTDLKGIITSVNRDFVRISGFTEAELIGQPHNIVRHPDMPPAAFADLWQTVQSGRPWTGIVKNRCKNGDYYWVEANVTPLHTNGQITGYMSVRNKPSRKQIEEAEALYRQLNAGGQLPRPSLFKRILDQWDSISLLGKMTGLAVFPAVVIWLLTTFGDALLGSTTANVIALLLVILVAVIALLEGRKLSAAINAVIRHMNSIAEGKINIHFSAQGESEIAGILRALRSLQIRLGYEMNETRKIAEEASRVRIALDNVSTGVMIADTDRNIIYANKSVLNLLKAAEADIRKQLPNFNASALLGANIDQFHKNPAHQAQMLATFTSQYIANIVIGGRSMRVTANPVINDKGERLGSVAEWIDRTAEVAAEREIEILVEAAVMGDFSKRIETSGKEGFFKTLGEGMNKLM